MVTENALYTISLWFINRKNSIENYCDEQKPYNIVSNTCIIACFYGYVHLFALVVFAMGREPSPFSLAR